jgi:uncharacterized protein YbcI
VVEFHSSTTSVFFSQLHQRLECNAMTTSNLSTAQQIAQAASDFETGRTGHAPKSVTVVLSGDTLVITLHGALSPAEKAVAQSPAAATQLRDYHRRLFVNSADTLRQEIKRITGVQVRDATAEIETNTGAILQIFATGTVVQVFSLASALPGESWTGSVRAKQS